MEGNSHALQWILDSNPVVGMDLGPDVANHAKKLGQDAFSVSLLRALHALHLASCSLFHLSRQVPLGAHGLGGVGKGIEERKAKAETEKEGSRQVEKILEQGQEEKALSKPPPSHGNSQTPKKAIQFSFL